MSKHLEKQKGGLLSQHLGFKIARPPLPKYNRLIFKPKPVQEKTGSTREAQLDQSEERKDFGSEEGG